jgi:pyrimidine operon attenuation protein/uracil phosphoribosyltransferase
MYRSPEEIEQLLWATIQDHKKYLKAKNEAEKYAVTCCNCDKSCQLYTLVPEDIHEELASCSDVIALSVLKNDIPQMVQEELRRLEEFQAKTLAETREIKAHRDKLEEIRQRAANYFQGQPLDSGILPAEPEALDRTVEVPRSLFDGKSPQAALEALKDYAEDIQLYVLVEGLRLSKIEAARIMRHDSLSDPGHKSYYETRLAKAEKRPVLFV